MNTWRARGVLSALFTAVVFTGCSSSSPQNQVLINDAGESDVCYVNAELRQSHFTIDPFVHLKDKMNAVSFALPTACDAARNMSAGQSIVDQFRVGSFLTEGSIGDWKFKVKDVPQFSETADQSSYRVRLKLSQSHFTLDIGKHLKDKMNAVEFDWDVPGPVYEQLREGQDLIEDGFRAGSMLIDGSAGDWNLDVVQKKGPTPVPVSQPVPNSSSNPNP